METEAITNSSSVDKSLVRGKINHIIEEIKGIKGHLTSDDFDVKHSFAEGAYIREMFIPKGMLLVGKIHRHTTATFVLKGDISIFSEDGVKRVKGPCHMVSSIGAKCGYAHEDTTWVTVHPTNETDLESIEREIIAKTYDEIDLEVTNIDESFKLIMDSMTREEVAI